MNIPVTYKTSIFIFRGWHKPYINIPLRAPNGNKAVNSLKRSCQSLSPVTEKWKTQQPGGFQIIMTMFKHRMMLKGL